MLQNIKSTLLLLQPETVGHFKCICAATLRKFLLLSKNLSNLKEI